MGQPPFEAIVATHHGEIYRYLVRITARSSEADDLSQETFLRAYRAYRGLAADANVRAWLFAIATNLSRNHFRSETRRRRAHAVVELTGTGIDGADPEGESRLRETHAVLEAVVNRLPLKQRLAFLMRKVHDLDYDTIGESLHCSVDSARAHVFQALRKIRRGLNGRDIEVTERSHER
jgi:RNA polymerase sigma-70 factor (ECF subfamily)